MTCIVGIVHKGQVYMGADSAGANHRNITTRADKKIFKNGDFLIGFTSSFRMGQLLQYDFSPPHHHSDVDIEKYMVKDFIKTVRECFRDGGFMTYHEHQEVGGKFLVGYKGRLFKIDSDFQVAEATRGFDATGCGEEYALGSVYSTEKMEPEKRIRLALEAAEEYSLGVRSPFHIDSI